MPGASLVAAVVSPDILDAIPGDRGVFFGMLHLECGTTCSETNGAWLLQGQWDQVKEAVSLLDVLEKAKTANKSIVNKVFFDTSEGPDANSQWQSPSRFVVEWNEFFSEIEQGLPLTIADKFKKIATAALKKEKETEFKADVSNKRPLTRRKGLPHRRKTSANETSLTTTLVDAVSKSHSQHRSSSKHSENNDDNQSVCSVDSVDVDEAVRNSSDTAFKTASYTTKNSKFGKRSTRINKHSAEVLNKMLRSLQPNFEQMAVQHSETVFPSRSGDENQIVDLTHQAPSAENHSQSDITSNTSTYTCPICMQFSSDSRGSIKIHAFTRHLAASFRCFICKQVFSTRQGLERHRKVHKREKLPFLRCLCSRVVMSQSGLSRHISVCKSLMIGAQLIDDPKAADGMLMRWRPLVTFDLLGHPKKSSGRRPTDMKFRCDFCDTFVASTSPKLVHHKLTQHPDESLRCVTCPSLTFANFKEFFEHNSKHVRKLPCDMCGKVFSSNQAFSSHVRTHEAGFEKAAFVCAVCEKAFTTSYVLKYHVQQTHLHQGRRFQCTRCDRSFGQKMHLVEHLYSHDGLKPYMCDICGKGFSHQTSLQQHKLTHGDETRYKCEECPKSFRTRASLVMHRSCHTERKHQCQYCGKLFTQKTARTRHERIHTGEQPFKCTHCDRAFSDSSVLRRHLLTHDPNNLSKRANAANPALGKKRLTKAQEIERRKAAANNLMLPPSSTAAQLTMAPPQLAGTSNSQYAGDGVLDLHLFSPMSILVNQQSAALQHDMISQDTCRSPETPPPISVPDHQMFDSQPQNLTFNQATSRQEQQQQQQHQPIVIQLPPENVPVLQLAGSSANSKFASYLQHENAANSIDAGAFQLLCSPGGGNPAASTSQYQEIYMASNDFATHSHYANDSTSQNQQQTQQSGQEFFNLYPDQQPQNPPQSQDILHIQPVLLRNEISHRNANNQQYHH